jgi:zinc and cadmium transporter
MDVFIWILLSGTLMSVVSLIGSFFLLFSDKKLLSFLLPMVAFAAGALLGGAFFHMLPAYFIKQRNMLTGFVWLIAGYSVFFVLEQFLHWHHCHKAETYCRRPLTYLILIGDGLHNFIGGLSVASTFLMDIRLGIITWLAAVAHEIPQEIGDFAVLIHGGWNKYQALLFNFLSALSFLLGALITYFLSRNMNVDYLIPFAAGNFIYIATSDLVPEVNKHKKLKHNIIHFCFFIFGIVILYFLRILINI